jgi:hypothetical protein
MVQIANVGEDPAGSLERLLTGAFFVPVPPRPVPQRSRFIANVVPGVAKSPRNSRIFADIRGLPCSRNGSHAADFTA